MSRVVRNGPQIAVLMTCHNRRGLTLRCLKSLSTQRHFDPGNVFIVDDGCTDGTVEAVEELLRGRKMISGTGSLFWNGGMRLAWDNAVRSGQQFDYFLWLNDDVELAPGCVETLVRDARAVAPHNGEVIIAAATHAAGDRSDITYGGHRMPFPGSKLRLSPVQPEGSPIPIDTMSGNVVLISAAAHRRLGNIHPDFEHIYGDLDYGLRAGSAGIPVFLSSRSGGACDGNGVNGTSLDTALPVSRRLKLRWNEDRKVHARDWRRFVRLHGSGVFAPMLHRIAPYLRILSGRPNHHGNRILNQGTPA